MSDIDAFISFLTSHANLPLCIPFILTVRLVHGIHPHQEVESLAVVQISRRSYISRLDLIRLK